jgi:hypothetical protein
MFKKIHVNRTRRSIYAAQTSICTRINNYCIVHALSKKNHLMIISCSKRKLVINTRQEHIIVLKNNNEMYKLYANDAVWNNKEPQLKRSQKIRKERLNNILLSSILSPCVLSSLYLFHKKMHPFAEMYFVSDNLNLKISSTKEFYNFDSAWLSIYIYIYIYISIIYISIIYACSTKI